MVIGFGPGGLQSRPGTSLTGPGAPGGLSTISPRPGSGGSSGRGGGGGGRSGGNNGGSVATIAINENEVIINGQGFSVAPGKLTEFLNSKGISGSTYQATLERAKQLDTQYLNKVASTPAKQLLLAGLDSNKISMNEIKSLNAQKQMNNQSKNQTDFFTVGQTPAFKNIKGNYEKRNTVQVFTDDSGTKVTGVEYGGKSYSAKGFENTFGAKVLYDPQKEEFFFGTVGETKTKLPSTISGDFKPITKEEQKQVKKFLFNAKIEKGYYLDAVTDTNVQKYIQDQKSYAFDKIVSGTTKRLDKAAARAKEQASIVLNASDFKSGNKALDITGKTLGRLSYWSGASTAYALNMISGLGNVALGLTFKQNETGVQLIKSAPAMIKQSVFEIGRTFTGNGTIEDFLGTAVTAATVGTAAVSFARLKAGLKNTKMDAQLKKDLPQIRSAVLKSQALLKKQQLYLQKVIVKNDNKWNTFGKGYQAMNGAKAKHNWFSVSEGGRSLVIQKSVITNKNVKITNIMVAKSASDKIFSFLKKWNNGAVKVMETYPNTKKLATYFSKIRAQRAYTFVEVRGSKGITAIDGKGNVRLINSQAELQNFIKNAKFGKFSFTGRRVLGGSIDTVMRKGKGFIGSGAFSRLGYSNTAGATAIKSLPSAGEKGYNAIGFRGGGGKRTPFSKTFGQQEQVSQLSQDIGLSKGISNSVTSSQLKNVVKAIEKSIGKNDLALKAGYRGVVTSAGLMFFTQQGKLVSPSSALKGSSRGIERGLNAIRDVIKNNTSQKPTTVTRSGSAQRSGQQSKQAQQMQQQAMQRARSGANRTRMNLKLEPKPKMRVPLPDFNYKRKLNLTKAILGNKLAPSYEIYIGSGKKVKKVGGRYTPAEAISKGAYVIDRTKERTVRIVPTKKSPNDRFKMNYLNQAGRKFRNYRFKKGQKVAYSSTRLIEKRKFFNDFRNEIPKRKKRR